MNDPGIISITISTQLLGILKILHFGQKKHINNFELVIEVLHSIVHPRQSFVNFCSDKCGFPKGQYNFGGLCLAIYYPVELRLTHRTPEHISSWSKYFHSMAKQEIFIQLDLHN